MPLQFDMVFNGGGLSTIVLGKTIFVSQFESDGVRASWVGKVSG